MNYANLEKNQLINIIKEMQTKINELEEKLLVQNEKKIEPHHLCPACLKKHYPEIADEVILRRRILQDERNSVY